MIMMRKYFNFLAVCMSFAAMTLFVSCSEDEPIPDNNNGGDETPGSTVSNGMYVIGSASNTLAVVDFQMQQGVVGDQDGVATRSGMFSSFLYLESGSFQFIQYTDGDSTIFGGALTETALPNNAEAFYYTGTLSPDGDAITTPADAGLYHLVVDRTSNTIVVVPVAYWEIIGPASAGGWNEGTRIPFKENTADGTVFELTGEILGTHNSDQQYKYRYNSNWDIAFDDVDGFNVFTNYGFTDDEFIVGGANLTLDEPGTYTITITFAGGTPDITLTKTGEADAPTFDATNFNWGVIGNATAGGWDSDRDLFYKGQNEALGHYWAGVVYLIADDGEGDAEEFKFRTNDSWDFNTGGTIGAEASELAVGGANIPAPAEAGAYYVVISTNDEGATWNGTMVTTSWAVIGEGSPAMGWEEDTDMTANGFAEGVTTYTLTGAFTTGEWKFRANDDWAINLGGDLGELSLDGNNITLNEGGEYTVTLSVGLAEDGTTKYSATVE